MSTMRSRRQTERMFSLQAADGATAALNNAKESRDAVQETLQAVNEMLANLSTSDLLRRLEETLADAEREVEGGLRPRLQDMEEKEEAQRRRLTSINLDMDRVLADIANLEEILRTIPSGCFNNPPIEEA
uniref:Laminin alpha domain-containing protein n=1 Tax=Fundulus heteroclitus TaxID=8078 RepID=A0A3Q2UPW1_FUNHE